MKVLRSTRETSFTPVGLVATERREVFSLAQVLKETCARGQLDADSPFCPQGAEAISAALEAFEGALKRFSPPIRWGGFEENVCCSAATGKRLASIGER
jgi:hypothetical protein